MARDGGDLVRTADWQRVREFAGSAAARPAPGALVVQGEAGAGKSTLWRAGVESAAATGCRVLRSEPSAAEAGLSFTALSDLLTEVLPAAAPGIPGPQREALEVALLLRSAGDEPPTARAVGMGVLAVLRSCLAAGPLLIAVDDAQWLDQASLEALVFALRRVTAGPLSLLLAARADAPADPLTAGTPSPPRGWRDLLAALPDAEEITLAPLDMWQVQQLLPGTVTAAQARRGPGRADLARRAGQADRADAAWRGAGQAEWLEWLQADAGNLATAVRWYLAHDPAPLPHLFRILWLFWARWDLENQAGP